MALGAHKYSAYEAAAFTLASDSESNGVFGIESTLESSDSYDSLNLAFLAWKLIKHKKMTSRYVPKKYISVLRY